jgi:hypothetical protein
MGSQCWDTGLFGTRMGSGILMLLLPAGASKLAQSLASHAPHLSPSRCPKSRGCLRPRQMLVVLLNIDWGLVFRHPTLEYVVCLLVLHQLRWNSGQVIMKYLGYVLLDDMRYCTTRYI